jgi:hypothetical protein
LEATKRKSGFVYRHAWKRIAAEVPEDQFMIQSRVCLVNFHLEATKAAVKSTASTQK